jgi:hypothetical protein
MFGLEHGLLKDLAVDVFTGGFGLGQLEEGFEGEGFGGRLDYGGSMIRTGVFSLAWWTKGRRSPDLLARLMAEAMAEYRRSLVRS